MHKSQFDNACKVLMTQLRVHTTAADKSETGLFATGHAGSTFLLVIDCKFAAGTAAAIKKRYAAAGPATAPEWGCPPTQLHLFEVSYKSVSCGRLKPQASRSCTFQRSSNIDGTTVVI